MQWYFVPSHLDRATSSQDQEFLLFPGADAVAGYERLHPWATLDDRDDFVPSSTLAMTVRCACTYICM